MARSPTLTLAWWTRTLLSARFNRSSRILLRSKLANNQSSCLPASSSGLALTAVLKPGITSCRGPHRLECRAVKPPLGAHLMANVRSIRRGLLGGILITSICLCIVLASAFAQQPAPPDPAEPQQRRPHPKLLPRPTGAIARQSVNEKSMRALIDQLVYCGTRLSLSSWTDPKRGIGCGRDHIVARLNEIAKASGGKLQVVVDKFDSTSERTSGKPLPLESVYAILPGSDAKLAKTLFIVSGHYDSRPSDVMNTEADAPGADDDASGVSVSVESARLLSKAVANGPSVGVTLGKGAYRATLLFAAIPGEEQGLLGGYRLLEW